MARQGEIFVVGLELALNVGNKGVKHWISSCVICNSNCLFIWLFWWA